MKPNTTSAQPTEGSARLPHPVWALYDRLRTARLNMKYYGARLRFFERANFTLELILLALAPSSAVAGLWFWQTEYGRLAWQWLGVPSALAAVLKPALGLTKRIKEYESVVSGYRALEYDYAEIRSLVEQKQAYDSALQTDFKRALQREKSLVVKNPESRECARLVRTCADEVNSELPPESFYVPEDR